VQSTPDNPNIPDKRKGALATYKIKQVQPLRVNMELDKWRRYVDMAINPYMYNRYGLYAFYREASMDPQVISQRQLLMSKVLCQPFTLVKKGENPHREDIANDPGIEKLLKPLKRPWMMDFDRYSMESDAWSHSLIEFDEMGPSDSGIVAQEFTKIVLVPREHVKPEWGEILIYPMELHGFSYREAPFSDWLVEIGRTTGGIDSLGYLLSASREVIWKNQTLSDAARYSEKFGGPLTVLKSASNDDKELDKKEHFLRHMGSNGYAILDKEDDITLLTTGDRGTGVDTYIKLLNYKDESISKLMTSQVLSTDTGSKGSGSYALGNVHEDTVDDVVKMVMTCREYEKNYILFPHLIKHGYDYLKDYDYRYVNLLKSKPVDPGMLNPEPGSEDDNGPQGSKKKVAASKLFTGHISKQSGERRALALSNSATPQLNNLSGDDDFLDEMATFAYENRDDTGKLNTDVYLKIAKQMFERFAGGFKTSYDVPEGNPSGFKAFIQQNLFPFSAARNFSELEDMRGKLLDENGVLKPLNVFKQDVAAINSNYNKTWLGTEYNYVQKSGVLAAKWKNFQDNDLITNLTWHTSEEENVCPICFRFDKLTLPKDHPFWKTWYPLLHFLCKCWVDASEDHAVLTPEPKAYDIAKKSDVKPFFQNNPGASRIVMKDDHAFFEAKPLRAIQELKAEDNYNLRPVEKILKNDTLAPAAPLLKDIPAYQEWVKKFMDTRGKKGAKALIGDVTGIDITAREKELAQFETKKPAEKRWEYANRLEDVLRNPDEAYQFYENSILKRSYIKYYDDMVMIAIGEVREPDVVLKTWYKWDGTKDSMNKVRHGTLLHLVRIRP